MLNETLNDPLTKDDDKKILQRKINKLRDQIDKINQFLSTDLRISKFAKSETGVVNQLTVENLEEKEDQKRYHQWVESQQKIGRD